MILIQPVCSRVFKLYSPQNIRPFIHTAIDLSLSIYPSVHPSIHLFIYPSIYPSIRSPPQIVLEARHIFSDPIYFQTASHWISLLLTLNIFLPLSFLPCSYFTFSLAVCHLCIFDILLQKSWLNIYPIFLKEGNINFFISLFFFKSISFGINFFFLKKENFY